MAGNPTYNNPKLGDVKVRLVESSQDHEAKKRCVAPRELWLSKSVLGSKSHYFLAKFENWTPEHDRAECTHSVESQEEADASEEVFWTMYHDRVRVREAGMLLHMLKVADKLQAESCVALVAGALDQAWAKEGPKEISGATGQLLKEFADISTVVQSSGMFEALLGQEYIVIMALLRCPSVSVRYEEDLVHVFSEWLHRRRCSLTTEDYMRYVRECAPLLKLWQLKSEYLLRVVPNLFWFKDWKAGMTEWKRALSRKMAGEERRTLEIESEDSEDTRFEKLPAYDENKAVTWGWYVDVAQIPTTQGVPTFVAGYFWTISLKDKTDKGVVLCLGMKVPEYVSNSTGFSVKVCTTFFADSLPLGEDMGAVDVETDLIDTPVEIKNRTTLCSVIFICNCPRAYKFMDES